jgi:hypothetical protein
MLYGSRVDDYYEMDGIGKAHVLPTVSGLKDTEEMYAHAPSAVDLYIAGCRKRGVLAIGRVEGLEFCWRSCLAFYLWYLKTNC